MYIPILSQKDVILDNNGNLIPGAKISVFDPVSNVDSVSVRTDGDYVSALMSLFAKRN